MYGYIYKTTNLVNNKIYIGQKHSSRFLGQKYLGSGKKLKDAIKYYGKVNFKVELLEEVELLELMDKREIYWIAYFNSTNSDIGYNLSEGGNVNRTLVGKNNPFYGKHHSEETREKMKNHNSYYMKGKHHSEETKRKISEKQRGKIVSEDTRIKLRENAKSNPNYGMKGKKVSSETKQKISLAKSGKPSKATGKIHITNDIEDKMIYVNELNYYINNGWRQGRKKFSKESCKNISDGHKGIIPHNIHTKWMNKNGINRCVNIDEVNKYLIDGWVLGMIKVHKIK